MTHDELVEKMLVLFLEKAERAPYCNRQIDFNAMAAVLRVCVEELLGNPYGNEPFAGNVMVLNFLKNRRARYSPPKPKTPEEMIETAVEELFRNGAGKEAERLVLTSSDGRDLGGWCKGVIRDKITGLIAELKERAK